MTALPNLRYYEENCLPMRGVGANNDLQVVFLTSGGLDAPVSENLVLTIHHPAHIDTFIRSLRKAQQVVWPAHKAK